MYTGAQNGSEIRQAGDEPPAYDFVVNHRFAPLPQLPSSPTSQIANPVFSVPVPSVHLPNLGFRPLPARVVPSGNIAIRSKRAQSKCSKKALIAAITGLTILCILIGLIILIVYVVKDRVKGTSNLPICPEGYSILDCNLGN